MMTNFTDAHSSFAALSPSSMLENWALVNIPVLMLARVKAIELAMSWA
jgi:hypothetical protein